MYIYYTRITYTVDIRIYEVQKHTVGKLDGWKISEVNAISRFDTGSFDLLLETQNMWGGIRDVTDRETLCEKDGEYI